MDIEKKLEKIRSFLEENRERQDEALSLLRELYDLCSQLKSQATIDFLTGLYNRRAFEKQLELAVERAKRDKGIFSLILLDIDHFKRINDLYGHLVGDEVLKKLAQLIKDTVRKVDFPARYGGEEFAIILPSTGFEGALSAAWRLKQKIAQTNFGSEKRPIRLTVSMGFGTYRPLQGLSAKEFLNRVDQLLYAAKHRGRDLIVHEDERGLEEITEGLTPEEKIALMGGVNAYDD